MLNAAWMDAEARFGAPPASDTMRFCTAGRIDMPQNGNANSPNSAVTGLRSAKKKTAATTASAPRATLTRSSTKTGTPSGAFPELSRSRGQPHHRPRTRLPARLDGKPWS